MVYIYLPSILSFVFLLLVELEREFSQQNSLKQLFQTLILDWFQFLIIILVYLILIISCSLYIPI